MDRSLANISKYLSFILRHKPQSIGLELDDQGWAHIDELIDKSEQQLTRAQIVKVVQENDKQRFALSEDKSHIRANQGHSIDVSLGLEPVEPPEYLYHGTAERFVEIIVAEGLRPMQRQHVHLSVDVETATKVGRRHGKPFLFRIPALELHRSGQQFFCSANGVWLTEFVDPKFLIQLK